MCDHEFIGSDRCLNCGCQPDERGRVLGIPACVDCGGDVEFGTLCDECREDRLGEDQPKEVHRV